MTLPLLVGALLNGLVTGMIYALMGVGLSVILGLLNLPNFTHGVLYALGAYFFFSAAQGLLGFWVGIPVAVLGVAALGAAIVRLLDDPGLRQRLGAQARAAGARYDIDLFVRKLERLYELLVDLADRGVVDFEHVRSIRDALAIAREWSRERAA